MPASTARHFFSDRILEANKMIDIAAANAMTQRTMPVPVPRPAPSFNQRVRMLKHHINIRQAIETSLG